MIARFADRIQTALRRAPVLCAGMALLAGCVSAPETIKTPVAGPEVSEARANPGAHAGSRVRWGGTIAEVRNLEDRTQLAVVARPLTRRGQPLGDQPSSGRFLAEIDGFFDPEVYQRGRRVTVVGRFTGIQPAPIDEYTYEYPLVDAEEVHLWEELARPYISGFHHPFFGLHRPFHHSGFHHFGIHHRPHHLHHF